MKIGEALIKARLITEDQLQLALERQKTFGGRIDTNIVESGFLDDAVLTRFLGQFLKLPAVTSGSLNSIPIEIIYAIKKEVVEKYGIVPFKKDGSRLHVAMLNPTNFKDVEDLRFITGFDILPYVITELKLRNALEKYYGIKQAVRHISIEDAIDIEGMEIERSESKLTGADTRKVPEEVSLEELRRAFTVGEDAEKETITGALLCNAFFTAKMLHTMKRSNLTDAQIEDEVVRRWIFFQKKVADRLHDDNR